MNATLVVLVAVAVGPSWIDGRGVMVAENVIKNQPIFPAVARDCTRAHHFAQFVNHCGVKPTAYIAEDLWLRAALDLPAHTELTVDYNRPIDFTTDHGTRCKLVPAPDDFVKC